MAKTATPIFTQSPKNAWSSVTGVDGSADGTDADVKVLFTAGATDGSYVSKLICTPISTSGSTTTSDASLRVYLNNGSTIGTAANNSIILDTALPATAVNVAGTAGAASVIVPLNIPIQAGYKLAVGVTAIAANTAWQVVAIYSDY